MLRRKGSSGWVTWPVNDPSYHDGGEGGMWVAAIWPIEESLSVTVPAYEPDTGETVTATVDPFIYCHGPEHTVYLRPPDAFVDPDIIYRGPSGEEFDDTDVLGAIVLGTTGACYVTDTGEYWTATMADIASFGLDTIARLNSLYQRRARLVTYIDT